MDYDTWVCRTCGAHFAAASAPPPQCAICADERQWTPPEGQLWDTMRGLLRTGYRTEIAEVEPNLLGIGVTPHLGVGHRGLLIRTTAGNALWDPPPLVDDEAVRAIGAAGGIDVISSSHPHMYGAAVELAREFDAELLLAEADLAWLMRTDVSIRTWNNTRTVLPGVTLIQCGGHFPGSAVLHWADGAAGTGVLCTGDTILVTPGEDRVTFMWSAPNRLPLPERGVRGIVEAVRPYEFDRIHAGWWHPVLWHAARQTVQSSAERYIQFLRGDVDIEI